MVFQLYPWPCPHLINPSTHQSLIRPPGPSFPHQTDTAGPRTSFQCRRCFVVSLRHDGTISVILQTSSKSCNEPDRSGIRLRGRDRPKSGQCLRPQSCFPSKTAEAVQTCSICQSALVDPVTTTSCKHTFCRNCITTALQHNPQCPIDRSALTLHSLRDTEQLVKLMLDELKVRCAAEGCEEVMQRGLLLAHSRSCLKGLVKCDDPECGLSVGV